MFSWRFIKWRGLHLTRIRFFYRNSKRWNVWIKCWDSSIINCVWLFSSCIFSVIVSDFFFFLLCRSNCEIRRNVFLTFAWAQKHESSDERAIHQDNYIIAKCRRHAFIWMSDIVRMSVPSFGNCFEIIFYLMFILKI